MPPWFFEPDAWFFLASFRAVGDTFNAPGWALRGWWRGRDVCGIFEEEPQAFTWFYVANAAGVGIYERDRNATMQACASARAGVPV